MLVLAVSLAPKSQAHAATIANPRVNGDGSSLAFDATWDVVNFGSWEVGGKATPIKWRVLEVKGDKALLLSHYLIPKEIKFNDTRTAVTWQNSTMNKWLNGTQAGSFIGTAFNDAERKLIDMTSLGGDGSSRVFLLDYTDLTNPKYGFPYFKDTSNTWNQDNSRRFISHDSRIAIPMGKTNYLTEKEKWWLRGFKWDTCQRNDGIGRFIVYNGGEIILNEHGSSNSTYLVDKNYYARPAIWVDYASPLVTYAGTVFSGYSPGTPGGSIKENFLATPQSITPATLDNLSVTLAYTKATYTGSALKPGVTVKHNETVLKEGADYSVSYSNNVNVGTAEVVVKGTGKRFNEVTKTFAIKPASVSKAAVSFSNVAYTGKSLKPSPKVKVSGRTLAKKTDYTVSAVYQNNKAVGKAKAVVTIRGKDNYTGSLKKTVSFKILPKKPTLSLKAGKKKLTLSTSKPAKNTVNRWEVNYRIKGAKAWKAKTYSSTKAISKSIGKLKSKKRYEVRVRSCKVVKGAKYYSSWSSTKAVKVS